MIKSIIPARILDASCNDVIFVGINSVEIKAVQEIEKDDDEEVSDYYLQDIIRKTDFDSEIRSAKILGRPREYEKVEQSAVGVPRKGKKLPKRPSKQPSFVQPRVPHHILALTLESSKLVFLCGVYDWYGHPQWLSSYRVLPDHAQSYSKRLGEHIAVDPNSRAMAVAANEGFFVLYALRSMDRLKEEVEAVVELESSRFDPILDVRMLLLITGLNTS